MASLDNNSVRDQVDQLKIDFESICASEKLSTETKFLIKSLFTILEIVFSIFLQKTKKKNSKNSSIPPSQTEEDNSSIQTGEPNPDNKPKKIKLKKGNFSNQKDRVISETITLKMHKNT